MSISQIERREGGDSLDGIESNAWLFTREQIEDVWGKVAKDESTANLFGTNIDYTLKLGEKENIWVSTNHEKNQYTNDIVSFNYLFEVNKGDGNVYNLRVSIPSRGEVNGSYVNYKDKEPCWSWSLSNNNNRLNLNEIIGEENMWAIINYLANNVDEIVQKDLNKALDLGSWWNVIEQT